MRALVLALCIVAWAAPALANPNQKAAAHYKQGKAFLDSGQYDKAIVEFEAAYAIDKVAGHLFNIARAYHAKVELGKAIEYYQKYLDADPGTKRAAEVRALIATASQAKAEADAKKKADEEAARLAAEKKRLEEEQAKKAVAATAHVKQAEAYALAGAYTKAGDEHRAAFAVDGDPRHLLAAAEAYRQQDLVKARAAYLAYLEKVPMGELSDAVRGKVAATTREIEKAEEAERQRKLLEAQRLENHKPERERKAGPPRRKSFRRGWIVVGGAMLVSGLIADFAAPNADNGVLDASDFAGPVLYGLATLAVFRGVF